MEKQTAVLNNKDRVIRSITLGILCILTLICIEEAVRNDVSREGYLFLMNIVHILGLSFLTVLMGILFFKSKTVTGRKFFLALFLMILYAASFFSSLANSVYHLPGHTRQITILLTASYFFYLGLFVFLWFYQKQFLKASALTRAITMIMVIVYVLYVAALVVNLFRPILFQITPDGITSPDIVDYISAITDCIFLMLLSIGTIFSKLNRNRIISFLICIFVPVLSIMLSYNHDVVDQNIYTWGIMLSTIVLPLCLVFINSYDELENDMVEREKEQSRLQVAVMISQMQPHFLYNCLASIGALCEEDPKLAAEATNAFSDYLRENMDFVDKRNPISFSEELNHIKTYVWLEKLRFPNKLNIEYEISCTAFLVPALSVQPMVENAIKHGICRKKSGGTVRICSFETDLHYVVTVSDDGTGFDVRQAIDDGRLHLGISNTRYRVREMVGGSLEIESTPGKGTVVTIQVPK